MQVEQVRDFLTGRMPFYLNMLKEMVGINSFTANPAGINAHAKQTATYFAELGFTAEYIQSAQPHYGKHLVLTRPGKTPTKVGMVSHLDTVFPPEEEIANNFHWREEGDRIYGPGTVDIKGGTVMMYMVLEAIKTFAPDTYNDTTWVLLIDASEEAEAEDFGQLCLDRLTGKETKACLVFEGGQVSATTANIVVARKGMAVYKITTEGKAAHAGVSHPLGANAVVQMSKTIQEIASFTNYDDKITFNVGVVQGGTVVNRVPHHATAKVEMRAYDKTIFDDGVAKMMALETQEPVRSGNGQFSCKVDVHMYRTTKPWPRNEATDGLFEIWAASGREVGIKAVREKRGGLSDGNHFWDVIPTLDGLGPAGGNAHCSERSEDGSKDQEYVLPGSFVPKAMLNIFALYKLINN